MSIRNVLTFLEQKLQIQGKIKYFTNFYECLNCFREWALESQLYHFFDFQVMTIAQTLVPFVLLVGLNLIIVRRMCSDSVQKEKLPEPTEVCFKEDRLLTQITPVHKSSTSMLFVSS